MNKVWIERIEGVVLLVGGLAFAATNHVKFQLTLCRPTSPDIVLGRTYPLTVRGKTVYTDFSEDRLLLLVTCISIALMVAPVLSYFVRSGMRFPRKGSD